MSHCESVDSSVLDTTVDGWDRHFAVNARAVWLLIKAFAEQLPADPTTEVTGRIVALTSDHTVHNLPYGAQGRAGPDRRGRGGWAGEPRPPRQGHQARPDVNPPAEAPGPPDRH